LVRWGSILSIEDVQLMPDKGVPDMSLQVDYHKAGEGNITSYAFAAYNSGS
jgi:hypothetical protein